MIDCEDYKDGRHLNCELETPGCKCAELDRLRAENATMKTAELCEISRLRAENAELVTVLSKLVPPNISKHPQDFAPEWIDASAILAKHKPEP